MIRESDVEPPSSHTERRVADHLHTVHDHLQPLRSDMGSIQDRAGQQATGRFGSRTMVFLVALVALGATGWWVTNTGVDVNAGDGEVVEATGTVPAPPPDAAPGLPQLSINESLQVRWDEHESPLGHFRLTAVSGGQMYVVSTAPGVRWTEELQFGGQLPQALYVSENGKDWSSEILEDARQISDLSAHGGVVYAIATAPLTARPARADGPLTIEVIRSDDDGATWDATTITPASSPPSDKLRFERSVWSQIAVTDAGVLVSVNTSYWADFLVLAPAEFRNPNRFFAEPRQDGLHIIDHTVLNERDRCMEEQFMQMEEQFIALEQAAADEEDFRALEEQMQEIQQNAMDLCGAVDEGDQPKEVAFLSWEEIGFDGARQIQTTELFLSPDGQDFEQIDVPELESGVVGDLTVAGGDYLMTTFDEFGGNSLHWSADGKDWVGLDPPNRDWVLAAGSIHGRLVLISQGNNGQGEALISDDQGATWSTAKISEAANREGDQAVDFDRPQERWLAQAAVGPMGVVAVFETFVENGEQFGPSYEVFYSKDAVNWELAAESRNAGDMETCCPSLSGSLVTQDEVVVTVASPDSDAVPSFAFVGTAK